ncbi:hypothetical protein ADK36_12310 [Streptomyces viridochromogenes]|nr:hypothetical protein ADK36_12310 [Streptomyces viridochromogenes]
MVRTDRGDMTVWAPFMVRDALDAHRAEALDEGITALRKWAHKPGISFALGVLLSVRDDRNPEQPGPTAADGQAYDGELAMLRGLVATLNAVAEHGDLSDVRKLLGEYASDDAAAREEKASRADTTPDFFQAGHVYAREHHGLPIEFTVEHVATTPSGDYRVAWGWRNAFGWTEEPWDCDDLDGWTDVTERGPADE